MAQLVTDLAVEPVLLPEAKSFLHVTFGDDDALITLLIKRARYRIQNYCNMAVGAQVWATDFEVQPTALTLLQPVTVVYSPAIPMTGVAMTIDRNDGNGPILMVEGYDNDYQYKRETGRTVIKGAFNGSENFHAEWNVGEPVVPPDICYAILELVDHMYSNRGADDVNDLPSATKTLLNPYRKVNV